MVYVLTRELWFPDVELASEEGLLAIGGDLTADRLELAYNSGIFPWYSEDQPILWWSPDPRMVLFPDELKVNRNLEKTIERGNFSVTENKDFKAVIKKCAEIPRPGQQGTWITEDMMLAYIKLHERGIAKSVEVWKDEQLVGGLYGIDLPDRKVFCGESMFSEVSDASKVALFHLVNSLKQKQYKIIDCQVYTDHLMRLGAREIPRSEFMLMLESQ